MAFDEMHYHFEVKVGFSQEELEAWFEKKGYTNLREDVAHDCGMTGYTRREWIVDGPDGVTNAKRVLDRAMGGKLKELLLS